MEKFHEAEESAKASSIFGVNVSMFRNCKSNVPKDVSLIQLFTAIIGARYSSQIANLRRLIKTGRPAAQMFKTSAIPAFTVSGVFKNGRKKENLVKYIPIVVLDIDDLNADELERLALSAPEIPYTLCFFRSPSGHGIKIFVATDCNDPEVHEKAWQQVSNYYSSMLDVKIDPSGKDFTRLCIVSADPKGYVNSSAERFEVDREICTMIGSISIGIMQKL